MKHESGALLRQKSVFVWIALAAGAVLLTPLVAVRFTTDVALLTIGGVLVAVFLYAWAELAVGLFTDLGG